MSASVVVIQTDRPRVQAEESDPVVVVQKTTTIVRPVNRETVVLSRDTTSRVRVEDARPAVVVIRRGTITINMTGNAALEYHGSPIDVINGLFGQPLRDTLHNMWWKCISNPSGKDWAVD